MPGELRTQAGKAELWDDFRKPGVVILSTLR